MTQQQQHQQQHIQYIEVVIDGGDEEVIDDERKKYTCSPFDNTCTRITCPKVTWQDLKILAQDCFQETGRIIFFCIFVLLYLSFIQTKRTILMLFQQRLTLTGKNCPQFQD